MRTTITQSACFCKTLAFFQKLRAIRTNWLKCTLLISDELISEKCESCSSSAEAQHERWKFILIYPNQKLSLRRSQRPRQCSNRCWKTHHMRHLEPGAWRCVHGNVQSGSYRGQSNALELLASRLPWSQSEFVQWDKDLCRHPSLDKSGCRAKSVPPGWTSLSISPPEKWSL